MAACATLALFAASAGAADSAADLRARFAEAYENAAAGAADDDAALRAYILYPYLRAARIQRELEVASGPWAPADDAAAELVGAYAPQPVARMLRRTWLSSLARRERWTELLEHYDAAAATPALRCAELNARIAVGNAEGLEAAVVERWLTPHRLPGECEAAFEWLRARGTLGPRLTARRVELLLDHGQTSFARVVARRLPADDAAPLLERADFIDDPASSLDGLAAAGQRDVDEDVVLEAWAKLARNRPEAALERFAPLAARASGPEPLSRLTLDLALGLAWDRRGEALAYFARVPAGDLDDYALEWYARAALWSRDWPLAAQVIAAMSARKRSEAAWRYWAARAAESGGDRDAAKRLYSQLLADDNYYSAMAAARLGERLEPTAQALPLDEQTVDDIAAHKAFARARELDLAGLRELATLEWHYGYETLARDARPQAIHLAARWGLHDIAVATATRHGVFDDYRLLYPRPFPDAVAEAEERTDVESFLLYGVLRQESLFRSDAASPAGALGIAQLMPDTARITARKWQLPVPSRAELFDPKIGIVLGAARLADLMERFDDQTPVALAAYNAGENAARRWLPGDEIDADVWIENIPYNETRAYVRRVLWHRLVFGWLESGRPQSTRDWLDEVRPLPDDTGPAG